jgi:hypothetical protein
MTLPERTNGIDDVIESCYNHGIVQCSDLFGHKCGRIKVAAGERTGAMGRLFSDQPNACLFTRSEMVDLAVSSLVSQMTAALEQPSSVSRRV